MTDDEFEQFKNRYDKFLTEIEQPQLFIYLSASTDKLKERINKRGISLEEPIEIEYLDSLGYLYDCFFDRLKVNMDNIDLLTIETDKLSAEQVLSMVLGYLGFSKS